MNSGNLQFVRNVEVIHDELMGMASESMVKDAVIALTSIIGENEQNFRIMSRRLDRMEDEVKNLQAGIKKLAEAVGVIL